MNIFSDFFSILFVSVKDINELAPKEIFSKNEDFWGLFANWYVALMS